MGAYLKKFLPYLAQCSIAMSSTLTFFPPTGTSLFLKARMESQDRTAHRPSFSLTWSAPVPKLSSPQIEHIPVRHRPHRCGTALAYLGDAAISAMCLHKVADQPGIACYGHTCIHKVAEEFPACGHLKALEALLLRNPIQCTAGRHTPSHTLQQAQRSPVAVAGAVR